MLSGYYVKAKSSEWNDMEQKWLHTDEEYGPFGWEDMMTCINTLANQERIRGAVGEMRGTPEEIAETYTLRNPTYES